MVCKCFDKKTHVTCVNKFAGSGIKNENILNKEFAEDLHKPMIRNLKKSTLIFYRQYVGCRFSRYAINK